MYPGSLSAAGKFNQVSVLLLNTVRLVDELHPCLVRIRGSAECLVGLSGVLKRVDPFFDRLDVCLVARLPR